MTFMTWSRDYTISSSQSTFNHPSLTREYKTFGDRANWANSTYPIYPLFHEYTASCIWWTVNKHIPELRTWDFHSPCLHYLAPRKHLRRTWIPHPSSASQTKVRHLRMCRMLSRRIIEKQREGTWRNSKTVHWVHFFVMLQMSWASLNNSSLELKELVSLKSHPRLEMWCQNGLDRAAVASVPTESLLKLHSFTQEQQVQSKMKGLKKVSDVKQSFRLNEWHGLKMTCWSHCFCFVFWSLWSDGHPTPHESVSSLLLSRCRFCG